MASLIFVTRGLHDVGGTERVLSEIASGLVSLGHEVQIVCLQKKGVPFFPLDDKIKITYLSDLKGICSVLKLRNFYKKENPDFIVAVGTNRSFLHVPASRGFRLISWEHFNSKINSHPLHYLSRLMAVRFGRVVVLTEEDAESYREMFSTRNVFTIHNPVTFSGMEKAPGEHKTILSVGRLKSQKSFDRLIYSWSLIAGKYPEWTLKIVGSGRKKADLEKQIKELNLENRVKLIPHTDNIKEYYRHADIYAMTSRYEGFALVLLEAFSASLPCVSFDFPFGPGEIKRIGAGIVVKDGDFKQFASALETLITDRELRENMGKKGHDALVKYSSERILNEWNKYILDLMKKQWLQ